ncbi:MAG: glycoside hydrolase family 71 protein, partial [Actinomycetota bacterium]|nr:glycoside hydrolase family 71 protein [Actinomycetota bacterium]
MLALRPRRTPAPSHTDRTGPARTVRLAVVAAIAVATLVPVGTSWALEEMLLEGTAVEGTALVGAGTSAAATSAGTGGALPAELVAAAAAPLPFDLPAAAGALRGSPRKAFAHYVPWFPASIDNEAPDYYDRNFLVPDGEDGKHAAYGGYLRDRPTGRAVAADAEDRWRLRDLEQEVRQASAAGLDGFAVDILQLGDTGGRQWTGINQLLEAAQNVDPGFSIMLMPDMSGPGMVEKDAATLAEHVAHLGASPAAHRLADGRLVVAPFTAERRSVAFWTQFLALMRERHDQPVAFLPLFQDERDWRSAFARISYGMANWGNRNPAWNDPTETDADSALGRAAAVRALGKAWMQPVSVQDQRPREGIFDEAENTGNLRSTWQVARDSGAEYVQIPTWNDYAEGTHIAPSAQNGPAWLDLNAYYLTWWKTGTAPAIVRDSVYLTHRGQPHSARPKYAQTLLMERRGRTSSPARDTVEALTLLTAPAMVQVTVGGATHTCQVDGGVDTCTVPLAPGRVSAAVVRSGAPVAQVTSPRVVTASPYVQDLQYVAASSGRQSAAGAAAPLLPLS